MLVSKVKSSKFSNVDALPEGKIVDYNPPSSIVEASTAPKEVTSISAPLDAAPASTDLRDESPVGTTNTTTINYNVATRPLMIDTPMAAVEDAIVVPTPRGVQGGSFGGGGGGGASAASEEPIVAKKKMSAWWWVVIAGVTYGGYKLMK